MFLIWKSQWSKSMSWQYRFICFEAQSPQAQLLLLFLSLQYPYKAVGQALEVIPRTLAQNCGVNVIRVMTALQAKVNMHCG
jgi:hypothetical protein